MESGLLLNVVVTQGATILKLFSGENQTLLVGGDSLLVLDLRLNIINCIARLDLKGDGLASYYSRETLADGNDTVIDEVLVDGIHR